MMGKTVVKMTSRWMRRDDAKGGIQVDERDERKQVDEER